MTSERCCPLQGMDDFDDMPQAFEEVVRRAAKPHICCECREPIVKGAAYEDAHGIWDGTWTSYRTCLSCREIRKHFACNGWIYGQLWSDIECNFFPDMKAGGPCLAGLSPAAMSRMFERRQAWVVRVGFKTRGAPPPPKEIT